MGYYKQKSVIGQPPEDSVTIESARVEANRAGISAEEYLVAMLNNSRRVAWENATLWDDLRDTVEEYENLMLGVVCQSCGYEPLKVGHDAECRLGEPLTACCGAPFIPDTGKCSKCRD